MSKTEKLKRKLLNQSGGFTWGELATLLGQLGFEQLEGSGSRVKFWHAASGQLISLHRPHPGNELKQYMRRQVIQTLRDGGMI